MSLFSWFMNQEPPQSDVAKMGNALLERCQALSDKVGVLEGEMRKISYGDGAVAKASMTAHKLMLRVEALETKGGNCKCR